jgi:hypothetical protein
LAGLSVEAILILFSGLGSLLGGVAGGIISAACGLVGNLVGLVIDLLGVSIAAKSSAANVPSSPRISSLVRLRKSRFGKWSMRVVWVLCILVILLVTLLETRWFQPAIRWVAQKQQSHTGISIEFDSVSGSLLKRDVHFQQLRMKRSATDTEAGFDLSVDELEADIAGLPWSRPHRITRIDVKSLAGDVFLVKQAEPVSDPKKSLSIAIGLESDGALVHSKKIRSGKRFVIDSFRVERSTIQLHLPGNPESLPMNITHWESAPLRNYAYGFDVLFRSNLEATIGDSTIKLSTNEREEGRKTTWEVENLDVHLLQYFSDEPWGMFEAGRVDVHVQDEWALSKKEKQRFIDMDWQIQLSDVVLKEAQSESIFKDILGAGFRKYLESQMKDDGVNLAFELRIRDGDFHGSATEALKQIWDEALTVLGRKWLKLDGKESETLKEDIRKAAAWLKKSVEQSGKEK